MSETVYRSSMQIRDDLIILIVDTVSALDSIGSFWDHILPSEYSSLKTTRLDFDDLIDMPNNSLQAYRHSLFSCLNRECRRIRIYNNRSLREIERLAENLAKGV